MFESPYIIQGNIRHYQELLRLDRISDVQRRTVIMLLAEAQAQLPLALAEENKFGFQRARARQFV
ncbi:MAG TPA: hypothetical protein VEU47_03725 [Candidatus Cybelea sp.]|jgi:hypothetical protein|nr:hypothetical protein [Candidatus Cybelea sp.]